MIKVLGPCPECGATDIRYQILERPEYGSDMHCEQSTFMLHACCPVCGTRGLSTYLTMNDPNSLEIPSWAMSNASENWNRRKGILVNNQKTLCDLDGKKIRKLIERLENGLCILSTDYFMEENFYQSMLKDIQEIEKIIGGNK